MRSKNIPEVFNYNALKYVLGTEINSPKKTIRKNLFMKLYIIYPSGFFWNKN